MLASSVSRFMQFVSFGTHPEDQAHQTNFKRDTGNMIHMTNLGDKKKKIATTPVRKRFQQ